MSDARYPLPAKASQTPTVWASAVEDGLLAVETFFSGTADPSTAHSWGATQVGKIWKDITAPYSPVWKEWSKLSATPTYGWRTLAFRKVRMLVTPSAAVTFSPASPRTTDVAFTALSLLSLLETVQDSGQTLSLVAEVILRVRVLADAAETLGADDGYIAFRATGSTAERRVYAPRDGGLGGRYEEREVTVPLDSSESIDFAIKVGGGTPSFAYSATIVGFTEATG